jgi:hypothetical protein
MPVAISARMGNEDQVGKSKISWTPEQKIQAFKA